MKPQTFDQLFDFYDKVVKLLYSAVQADNNMPQETLFEINAAFDHLARHWTEGEDEPFVAEKVYSHLKRGVSISLRSSTGMRSTTTTIYQRLTQASLIMEGLMPTCGVWFLK